MTATPPAERVSDRRLLSLSIVLLLGTVTTLLDTTIVNVALPHLHDVFHASVADTQWVSSAYLLALAGVIPLTGWASERYGTRRVWMTAVALFMIGSALCGFAWDLPSLVSFRVLQGIGGGMVLPVMVTILTQAAGPARLGRAIATMMLPANFAPILGPILGGAIVDSISWNWLFFVNVPLCVIALLLAPKFLPAGTRNRTHRLDLRGFLLLTPGLVAVALGVSEAGRAGGFAAVSSWLPMAAGVTLVASFVFYSSRTAYWSRRQGTPLIDVRLFTRRSFGLASVVTFVSGFSTFAVMFLIPQFYQVVRGETALRTGLLLIPLGAGTVSYVFLNRLISRLVETRFIVVGGIALSMLGALPYAFAGASGNDVLLLVAQFLQGFGAGAVVLCITTLAFVSLGKAEIPRASAGFGVVQRVGAPFGVTVVAVLLQGYLAKAEANHTDLAAAFGATFWWIIAFSTVPLLLGFFLPYAPRRTPEPTADQTADQTPGQTSDETPAEPHLVVAEL